MNNKSLPYWLVVEESKTVRFSELAHLMAKAMHPGGHELMSYAAARINLETELKQAVKDGALTVRNAAGLGRHTFAHGDALQRAVMLPQDLRPFLAERGIELRLTPHGNGPDLWTLENAAAAIAEQEQWHDGARGSLESALLEAASSRALVVRNPHTDLPKTDGDVRAFYELVTPSDVNAWLEKQDAPYRWSVARPEVKPEPQAGTSAPVADSASNTPLGAPPPVPTGDVAHAFDGLRGWNEKAWKDTLGSPPKWLDACIAIRGQRGIRETRWNPVLIGAALVHNSHAKPNSIRAKFQTKPQLKDWLEAWKTYEADNFDAQ